MAKKKKYSEMNLDELREATKDLNEEFAFEKARPLTLKGRREHALAAKRGRGRPKVGKGAANVLVSMEKGLLSKADSFAKHHKMSRSELIAMGLKLAMSGRRKSA
jgi:hypothetical protein